MRLGSAGGSGAECGTPARDHSRRRETSEHSGDQRWTHEIDGLRDGAAFEPRYEGYFPAGDAGLLVPGADHGAGARCALGHFFAGSAALRNADGDFVEQHSQRDRKSTRLNSSHLGISYAVFCLKNKKPRSNPSIPLAPATSELTNSRAR